MLITRSTAVIVTLLLLTAQLPAQERGRGMYGRRGLMSDSMRLVSFPEVREELAMDEEQEQLLDALRADLSDQHRTAFRGGLDDPFGRRGRSSQFEQIGAKLRRLNRQSERLLSVILEPDQWSRLNQLRLQYEGHRAFDRDAFLDALELTDRQRERIREIRESAASRPGRIRRDDPDVLAEIKAELTETQIAEWEEMKGASFNFPERRRRPRRRGSRDRR